MAEIKTVNVSRSISFIEKIYLVAIVKGLWITLKRLFRGMILGQTRTIRYPEERRAYSQRFRGMHFISVDENKTENCTACYLCETVCPAECITIVAEERRPPTQNLYGVKKEKRPLSFQIDALRCCFCGMCEEACPKDAIKLSMNYEMAVPSREKGIYSLTHLTREIKGRGEK